MTNMFRDELEKRLDELTIMTGERNNLQGVVEELHGQMRGMKESLVKLEVSGGHCTIVFCD